MSWWTVTIRLASASSAPEKRSGSPSSASVPASGGWTPAMILASVDLPAPFSPTSPCTRPAAIEKSTPRNALTAAKLFTTPLQESSMSEELTAGPAFSPGRSPRSLRGRSAAA